MTSKDHPYILFFCTDEEAVICMNERNLCSVTQGSDVVDGWQGDADGFDFFSDFISCPLSG